MFATSDELNIEFFCLVKEIWRMWGCCSRVAYEFAWGVGVPLPFGFIFSAWIYPALLFFDFLTASCPDTCVFWLCGSHVAMLALTLSTACLFSCCHPFGAAKCHGYIGKYSELTGVAAIGCQPICMYTFYVQDELPMVCHNGVRTSVDWVAWCFQPHICKMGPKYGVKCLKIKITKRSKPHTVVGHVVSQLTQLFSQTFQWMVYIATASRGQFCRCSSGGSCRLHSQRWAFGNLSWCQVTPPITIPKSFGSCSEFSRLATDDFHDT